MALLGRSWPVLALALASACYSPDLRDCTVSCESASDCAHGQQCGADHLCAAAARAGHCLAPPADGAPVDASSDAPLLDARPDARPRPDAGPSDVVLHIHIDGLGQVRLEGGGTCSSNPSQDHLECYLDAPANVPAMLDAIPAPNFSFEHWTTAVCDQQGPICTFTPVTATDVGVRFRKEDH